MTITPNQLERLEALSPGLRILSCDEAGAVAWAVGGYSAVLTRLEWLTADAWGAALTDTATGDIRRCAGTTIEDALAFLEYHLEKQPMDTITITPIRGNVWLEAIDEPAKTYGGIIIPDDKRDHVKARVLAVGSGLGPRPSDGGLTPVPVEPGDVVLLTWCDWIIGDEVPGTSAAQRVIDCQRLLGVVG